MSRATGRLAVMGNIDIVEPDGGNVNYPRALLILFDSADEIRKAINDMELKLINYHDEQNSGNSRT